MKRRRVRSPHPGVVLIAPRGEHGWRARYVDPDSGGTKFVSLGPRGLDRRTDEARRLWAIEKSRALKDRLAALDAGDQRATGKGVAEAVVEFLARKEREGKKNVEGKSNTLASLRPRLKRLVAWTAKRGRRLTTDLRPADLHAFRDHVWTLKRTVPAAGGEGRGVRKETDAPLSGGARNGYVAAARNFLNDARRRGLVLLTRDAISDALKEVHVEAKRLILRDSDTIQRTLGAARRADEAHGEPEAGPLVLLALLTGMRKEELVALDWEDVNLGGTGVLALAAFRTKTQRGRDIDLAVSPAVRDLLARLHLRAGRPERGLVFPCVNMRDIAERMREHGAPNTWTWKVCRSTSGSWLACAPGCGYTLTKVALRMGHDAAVAQKHYVDAVHGIDPKAATLEKAMRVERHVRLVLDAVGHSAPPSAKRRASVSR